MIKDSLLAQKVWHHELSHACQVVLVALTILDDKATFIRLYAIEYYYGDYSSEPFWLV